MFLARGRTFGVISRRDAGGPYGETKADAIFAFFDNLAPVADTGHSQTKLVGGGVSSRFSLSKGNKVQIVQLDPKH